MSGVLTIGQYLGGPDDIIVEQTFPSNQKTLIYNFNTDITGWTFSADYQAIVVDTVQFSRATGQPNFTNSTVLGTFPKVEVTSPYAPQVVNAEEGTVKVHFPANMYPGAIIPDARKNVPIVIYSFTWTDNNTPAQTQSHRTALVQAWEPDVVAGDPTLEDDYTAIVTGA
jgi:hypothetical protein